MKYIIRNYSQKGFNSCYSLYDEVNELQTIVTLSAVEAAIFATRYGYTIISPIRALNTGLIWFRKVEPEEFAEETKDLCYESAN